MYLCFDYWGYHRGQSRWNEYSAASMASCLFFCSSLIIIIFKDNYWYETFFLSCLMEQRLFIFDYLHNMYLYFDSWGYRRGQSMKWVLRSLHGLRFLLLFHHHYQLLSSMFWRGSPCSSRRWRLFFFVLILFWRLTEAASLTMNGNNLSRGHWWGCGGGGCCWGQRRRRDSLCHGGDCLDNCHIFTYKNRWPS